LKTVETRLRVRYSETDRMGIVYHGHYIAWF
jgi:acyl-CoA thioester hydrolase